MRRKESTVAWCILLSRQIPAADVPDNHRWPGRGRTSPEDIVSGDVPTSGTMTMKPGRLITWGARPDVTARDQQQMLLAMRAFYGAPSRTFAQNKAAVHLQNIITVCVIRQRATQRVRTREAEGSSNQGKRFGGGARDPENPTLFQTASAPQFMHLL